MRAPLPPVLDAGRHPEPRRASPTPGSIHEGGELGYVLVARLRRGVRQPRPDRRSPSSATARPRPGRSRARGRASASSTRRATARCCRSCTSTATRSPGPTVLGRASDEDVAQPARGPRLRRRTSSRATIRAGAPARSPRRSTTLLRADPRDPGGRARAGGVARAPALAGDRAAHAEGLDRARRSSTACRSRARSARTRCRSPTCATNPEHLAMLEAWMRSYRPEELFDDARRLVAALRGARADGRRGAWARTRTRTAGAARAPLDLPDFDALRASTCRAPATERARVDARARRDAARHLRATNPTSFRLFCPDETNSNRLGAVFEVENRCLDGADARDRRPRVARRPGDGGAERAQLPGLARGLRADRPARAVRDLRGVRDGRRRR